jgi:hypothetical protein
MPAQIKRLDTCQSVMEGGTWARFDRGSTPIAEFDGLAHSSHAQPPAWPTNLEH